MPSDMTARELVRWSWRQLTSMRTALVLLLLLALAAIPGSVVPQQDVDALDRRPVEGRAPRPDPGLRAARPVLGLRLGVVLRDLHPADDLAGRVHPARAPPSTGGRCGPGRPRAPRNLSRLPEHASYSTDEARRRRPRARPRGAEAASLPRRGARGRGVGREGLPARGRQPALPPVGARGAGRLRGRRRCSASRPA